MTPNPREWNRFKDIRFLIRNRKDLIALVREGHRRCGDYVSCSVLGAKMYLVSDPDAIETVLHSHQDNYIQGEPDWSPYVRALGRGLLFADGQQHRWQRGLVQAALDPQRIAAYASTTLDAIQEVQRNWENRTGTMIDVHQEMLQLALTVVVRTIFADTVISEISRIGELSTRILLLSTELYFQPAGRFPWLPTPKQAQLKRLIQEYDGILYEAIRKRRTDPSKGNDLLSMLLQDPAKRPESARHAPPLSEKDVRDLAVGLLSAGHETTANMLSWAWYLLAKNPEAQKCLHSELRRVLGGRAATVDDLNRLPYTAKVIKETLRMYPPVWLIARRAIKDDVIRGYRIPAGGRVFMSPYIVQRDARWHENPDRFDPSRVTPEDGAPRPRFSYFPFGAGSRHCVGQPFAEMVGRLVIANLAQRFSLREEQGRTIEPDSSFLRPRGGMKMCLANTSS